MNKTSVLIAEDEGIVAEDLSDKLKQLGFRVAGIASRSEEAKDMALKLRPQLILMDIQLGGQKDGIWATDEIQREYDVPVIYLTAHSDPATLARAKVTGPLGYVLKPFETRDLATQIELALYRHQAEQQLREQRELLRVTLTSIGDAVIATDVQGQITFMNPVAETLTGWPLSLATGKPLAEVFHIVNKYNRETVDDPVSEVLKTGLIVGLANHTVLQQRGGREVAIDDSGAPILDKHGNHLGVVLVFRDITERKLFEEQLQTLNNELELRVEQRTRELQETQAHYLHVEKLSAIGKLSASIAHELNNPLQSIMTILQGLKKRAVLEEEDRELLELAIGESKRIRDLLRSLHDFNRPSSGRKEIMDVHQSLDALLLLCKKDFSRKQITVVCNYAEQLPQILAVQDQIKQVLINLLTNAAEACLQPGGVVTISTWREDNCVAVAIQDTGIGIASDELDHIFRPFYTTKAEVKGTGLGLSISHGIIQKHHGQMRVVSQPGEGSTFTVLLPIKT